MDNSSFSSFLADLIPGVIGSVDVAANVHIVHDASILPSESLLNMNRRACGMKDFDAPTFLKKETKEKKNRWGGGLLVSSRGNDPTLVFQDPASPMNPARRPGLGSRQGSDSMLMRPSRSPPGPNSPKQPRKSTGKKDRWESSAMPCVATRSDPTLVAQDPAPPMNPTRRPGLGSRASSDSMLMRPNRSPPSPNSPKQPHKSTGKKDRWESFAVPCLATRIDPALVVQDPAPPTNPTRRPGLGSRQCSDSMLLKPRRRPSSPNSPTPLLTIRGLGGKIANRDKHLGEFSSSSFLSEEVMSPQANGATASKFMMTDDDRRTLTQSLSNSMLSPNPPKKEEMSSDVDEKDSGRHSLLQKQPSDAGLVNPELGGVLLSLPFHPDAIEELGESLNSLVYIDSEEAESPLSSQSGIFAGHFNDSASSITERHLISLPTANAVDEANDNIKEQGSSVRTIDLEADRIDNKEDESEGSLWLQELEFSMSSNRINSSEEETGLGSQTKFLARTRDSLLLLHPDAAGSRENNLCGWQSMELRIVQPIVQPIELLQRRAQGLLRKISSEQTCGNISDSSLISVDADTLKTGKQDPTATQVIRVA